MRTDATRQPIRVPTSDHRALREDLRVEAESPSDVSQEDRHATVVPSVACRVAAAVHGQSFGPSPEALATGRAIAARIDDSAATKVTCVLARVTAV